MSDLISRKAAIDFIDAGRFCNPNEPRWSDSDVVDFLKSRPSIERWTPCKDELPKEVLDTDLIPRRSVLNEIEKFSVGEGASVACSDLYAAVYNMPSAPRSEKMR